MRGILLGGVAVLAPASGLHPQAAPSAEAQVTAPVGQEEDAPLRRERENLTNKYYITYNSQTVGTNDTYFAGRGRTVTLGLASDL